MIAQLRGAVLAAGGTWVVIDVGGLGLRVLCTPGTAGQVRPGEPTVLHTTLVVREDSLALYGFATADERDCFELVQSATGVGPKLALAVVSVLNPDDLRQAIAAGNLGALTRVPGIGPKVAQRLVLELKDKVGKLAVLADRAGATPTGWRDQVASGLEGLGWSRRDAEAACDRVADLAESEPAPGVAVLMRAALRSMAK